MGCDVDPNRTPYHGRDLCRDRFSNDRIKLQTEGPTTKTALLTAGISQPCIRRTLWFADTIYLCLVNRYNSKRHLRRFSERLSARSLRQNPMQLANTVGQACRPRLKDMQRENLVHMSMTNC
jgi:hypothetical protein